MVVSELLMVVDGWLLLFVVCCLCVDVFNLLFVVVCLWLEIRCLLFMFFVYGW